MVIWASTLLLVVVLVAIVKAEVSYGRRSKVTQKHVNEQINELAKTTFDRHRDVFGKDPTGSFPIFDASDGKK